MKNLIAVSALVAIAASCSTQMKKKVQTTNGADINGLVTLRENGSDVRIRGLLTGFEPDGAFGFHVHENADCSGKNFKTAGGHYAPNGHKHGYPDSELSHKGDLGNLVSDSEGVVRIDKIVENTSLADSGKTLKGQALIIHAEADDYTSQPSGDSGARIGCVAIR